MVRRPRGPGQRLGRTVFLLFDERKMNKKIDFNIFRCELKVCPEVRGGETAHHLSHGAHDEGISGMDVRIGGFCEKRQADEMICYEWRGGNAAPI